MLLLGARMTACRTRPYVAASLTLHNPMSSARNLVAQRRTLNDAAKENVVQGEQGLHDHAADASHVRDELINLQTITQDELMELFGSWGESKFRAKQVIDWVRDKGQLDPRRMHNLPSTLRERLAKAANPDLMVPLESALQGSPEGLLPKWAGLRLVEELKSKKDDTIKRVYRLFDGQLIESVLMYSGGCAKTTSAVIPSKQRRTACISSQAGCAMGCVFCSTGQMGFARQLSADEIFEQAAAFASELRTKGDRLTHVVFMGMGEPLANYRNVLHAARRINKELGLAARKITISTVGIPNSIRRLATEDLQVNLAVSLHESNEMRRSALLPANHRYGGLRLLFEAISEYMGKTNRRVSFEWALIRDINDSPTAARELGQFFEQYRVPSRLCHINVIPLNPTPEFSGGKPDRATVNRFCEILVQEFGISATPRVRKGIDIDAGCGQLKSAVLDKENKRAKQARDRKS